EGSGILMMETLETALERGAHIYGVFVGYGSTGDAYHISAPADDGEGAARAMLQAIDDAASSAEAIDYINDHGTSTDLNDKYETDAIKSVFGNYAKQLPVSSTKSMTGHLLGAGRAVEAVISLKAIGDGILPPTINYEEKDPLCDLDYVPNEARN